MEFLFLDQCYDKVIFIIASSSDPIETRSLESNSSINNIPCYELVLHSDSKLCEISSSFVDQSFIL